MLIKVTNRVTNDPRFYPTAPPAWDDPRICFIPSLTVLVPLGRAAGRKSVAEKGVPAKNAPPSFNFRSLVRAYRSIELAVLELRYRALSGEVGPLHPERLRERRAGCWRDQRVLEDRGCPQLERGADAWRPGDGVVQPLHARGQPDGAAAARDRSPMISRPWIILNANDGGRYECLRCGGYHMPAYPIETWAMSALGKAFEKEHKACKAPKEGLVCSMCGGRGHEPPLGCKTVVTTPEQWLAGRDTGRRGPRWSRRGTN